MITNANRYFFKRFGLKSVLLGAFALLETATGLKHAMTSLFAVSAVVSAMLAMLQRSRLDPIRLTYWDESAGLLMIALLASCLERLE